jgi:hypothetical protein
MAEWIWYEVAYFKDYRITSATEFQYGYQEVLAKAVANSAGTTKTIMTDAYGQPYIYVLLYNRITPQAYQYGALNAYEFHRVDLTTSKPHYLYLATPTEISPTDPRVIDTVKIPDTDTVVWVIAKT